MGDDGYYVCNNGKIQGEPHATAAAAHHTTLNSGLGHGLTFEVPPIAWPEETTLTPQLEGIAGNELAPQWGADTQVLLAELPSAGHARRDELLKALRIQVRRIETLMVPAQPSPEITTALAELRRAMYALSRRLDIWENLVRIRIAEAKQQGKAIDATPVALTAKGSTAPQRPLPTLMALLPRIEKLIGVGDIQRRWKSHLHWDELQQLADLPAHAESEDLQIHRRRLGITLLRNLERTREGDSQRAFIAQEPFASLERIAINWLQKAPIDDSALLADIEALEAKVKDLIAERDFAVRAVLTAEQEKQLDELEGRYPGAVWVQVSALRGDAERELGRPSEAVLAWDAAWPEANEIETPRLRNRIQGAIASLSRAELHALRDDVASGEVGALVDQEIASRTPPPITDPIPPVAAESASVVAATVAPDNQAPEKDTVVGAWRRFNEDSSAASRTRDDGTRAATAPAETVILESGSAPAPVPSPEAKVRAFDESETPPVAAETTPQNDEDVAQLIKVDGPLDADSANFEPAAAAPVAAGDGKVGLRRIEYPGAVAGPAARREPAPSVDTLEKLEVTGEPAAP